jgi:hypothetical protein
MSGQFHAPASSRLKIYELKFPTKVGQMKETVIITVVR